LARYPNAVLTVAGDGPWRGYYERRARWLGASVRFVGQVFEERPEYYASADLYLCPTTIASFGVTLLEAMACGTPMIVSDNLGVHHAAQEENRPGGPLANRKDERPVHHDRRRQAHDADPDRRRRRGLRALLVHVHERFVPHVRDAQLPGRIHPREVAVPGVAERGRHPESFEGGVHGELIRERELGQVDLERHRVERRRPAIPALLGQPRNERVDPARLARQHDRH